MEILLKRKTRTNLSTIGDLIIGDVVVCKILEDYDRGLVQWMTIEAIAKRKVFGKTAIPAGRYTVAITKSARFKTDLPILENVPGFEGIRIHPGNTAEDTEGCLLPGMTASKDFVGESRVAFKTLFGMIKAAIDKEEKVFITIE